MKAGDYIRTKNGVIAKIESKRKNLYGEETIFKLDKEISIYDLELSSEYLTINPLAEDTTNEIDTHFGDEKIIIKSSPRIIDLIQVGDILCFKDKSVCRVLAVTINGYYLLKDFGGEQYYERKEYINELSSILTKEQISQMEYKL